ncbi:MAG: outer membrane protein assembly factor BamB family protein [Promethearchaeota archaeon]
MHPAVDAHGNVYVQGSAFRSFTPNGNERWNQSVTSLGSPTISGGVVYFSNGSIVAVNATTGATLWSLSPESRDNQYFKPAVGDGGVLYVGTEGAVVAVKPDGSLKWTCDLGSGVGQVRGNPALAADGTIYVGTKNDDGSAFFAITPDGVVKWKFKDPLSDVYSSPAVGRDGEVYFASEDRKVFAVDGDTGALNWTVDLQEDVTWSSANIDDAGRLFIADMSGRIYCIECYSPGLAQSTWPRFAGNSLSSSYVP